MKKKLSRISSTAVFFAVLIYLGQNTYLLEWLAKRYFCFIWIPILLFWIIRQDVLARWLTLGSFLGLILGQIMEDMKWQILGLDNQTAHSSYWGVGIWFSAVVLCFGFGIIHTWLKLKRNQKSKPAEA